MIKKDQLLVFMKRIVEKTAKLTPPEGHGPEVELFRGGVTTLYSWKNKQLQNWNFFGHLNSASGRPFDFSLKFSERKNYRDYLLFFPVHLFKDHFFHAQFSLTDSRTADSEQSFYFKSRGSGSTLYQGFASENSFHLHQDSWDVFEKEKGVFILTANAKDISLYLELKSENNDFVFLGQGGYLDLGSESGHSYYQTSIPRLKAEGKLVIGGNVESVSGQVWFDHQKTSLAWETDTRRSPYFEQWVLPISKDETLVLFASEYNKYLTKIDASGKTTLFVSSEFKIENREYWTSKVTGNRYPIKRTLSVESLGLELLLKPEIYGQEIWSLGNFLTKRQLGQWVGAVSIEGNISEKQIHSRGFLSMTGFDQNPISKVQDKILKVR